jgi:transposase
MSNLCHQLASKSPDLKLIEYFWRFIKHWLRNRKPHSGRCLEELKAAVVDIWNNELTCDYFKRWIDYTPERLQAHN